MPNPLDKPEQPSATGSAISSDIASLIIEFAEPLLRHCADYRAREKAISYAILAWNLSLEKTERQEKERLLLERTITGEDPEQIHQLFDFLLQRKQQIFPDNRFYIVDYQMAETERGMEIQMNTKYVPRSRS
jgi:hypothetical protein